MPAGLYDAAFDVRLQHLADAVVALEAVPPDADLLRIIPDPDTCVMEMAALFPIKPITVDPTESADARSPTLPRARPNGLVSFRIIPAFCGALLCVTSGTPVFRARARAACAKCACKMACCALLIQRSTIRSSCEWQLQQTAVHDCSTNATANMTHRCRGMLRLVKLPAAGTLMAPEPAEPLLLARRHRQRLTLQVWIFCELHTLHAASEN